MEKLSIERRDEISRIIMKNGKIKIKELIDYFHVSGETIRKDLIILEKQGVLQRGHGGAIAISSYQNLPIHTRITEKADAKGQIADALINMLPQNSILFLGPGSTTLVFASYLMTNEGYTIITNSLSAAYLLNESKLQVLLVGGELNSTTASLSGSWAMSVLDDVHVDYAILGTNGFMDMSGPSTYSYDEIYILQRMIKQAKHSVVIADASKAQNTGQYGYATWDEIEYLITNASDLPDTITKHTHVIPIK